MLSPMHRDTTPRDSFREPLLRGRGVFRALERTLLCAGALMATFYVAALAAGEYGRRSDLAMMASTSEPVAAASSPAEFSPDTSLWAPQRIRDFLLAKERIADTPLGVLRIPTLQLVVPIYPNTSELHLNRGVGLIDGMAGPDRGGNLGVAGHRDGFFRVLKDLSPGAVIEVQTPERVHRYRVVSIDVVEKEDRRLLADTDDPTITLVTCHPFYYLGDAPRRFIVRGAYLWPSPTASSRT